MISATLCYSQDSHAFPPKIHVFESAGQTSPMRLRTLKSGLPNGSKLSTSVQKKCQRLPIRSLSEKCKVSTHHWIFSLMVGGNLNYSYTVHQLFYQTCSHCPWKENASNQQFVRAGSWRRIWWIPLFAIPWAIPISGQARAATCQTESFAVSDNSSLEVGSASFCLVICLLK